MNDGWAESEIESLRTAAEEGDAWAQYTLGACLASGEFGGKDLAEAAKWYRNSAEQGRREAQYELGLMNILGEGIPKNQKEGERWLNEAARNGDRGTLEVLGEFYEAGVHGFAQDSHKAIELYSAAIDQGSARAKFCLGMLYFEGKQIPKDKTKGLELIRESDKEGYQYARDILSREEGNE